MTPFPMTEASDLRDLMERTIGESAPDRDFAALAISRGRPRRRARLAGVALAAAAAVVAGSTGIAMLANGAGTREIADVASDPATSTGPRPTAGQSMPEPAVTYAEGWWSTPATDMLDLLGPLVPEGVTLEDPITEVEAKTASGSIASHGYLGVTVTSANGTHDHLDVFLYPPDSARLEPPSELDGAKLPSTPDMIECPEAADANGTLQCRSLVDESGTAVGSIATFLEGTTRTITATVLTADRGAVQARLTQDGRHDPVLTQADLRAIASSPSWTGQVSTG